MYSHKRFLAPFSKIWLWPLAVYFVLTFCHTLTIGLLNVVTHRLYRDMRRAISSPVENIYLHRQNQQPRISTWRTSSLQWCFLSLLSGKLGEKGTLAATRMMNSLKVLCTIFTAMNYFDIKINLTIFTSENCLKNHTKRICTHQEKESAFPLHSLRVAQRASKTGLKFFAVKI